MKSSVTFKCPGCELMVTMESDPYVFIHPEPTCEKFERCDTVRDAVDLMREARLKEEAGVS